MIKQKISRGTCALFDHRIAPIQSPAGWRSGDAADCKSVYTGSIPVPASTIYCVFSLKIVT
jgi:hypothetical protein